MILLIVLRAQAMVVENTMYPLLPASNDDNNASFGIDLSNENNYSVRNSNLNGDTDGDKESVVAEEIKNQMQEEEEQFISLINNKKSMIHSKSKSKSKRSKGTPPASITKIGTYYRVINVYFDEIHCSNVAKLGSAPSISKLDSRQFLHKHVYDCLLETYSDVSNNNNDWLAFDNQYFDDVGVSQNAAKDFDQDLTSLEFKQTMEYINFHYQIAHQNNKKSGSHDEFHCFVGCCPYLLYYHLWQAAVPNFPHLAFHTLPVNVMKESSNPSATTTSFSEVTNKGKKGKYAIKKQSNSDVASALLKMAEQHNEIIKDKTRLESEKHSLQLEHTLTELIKGYHENLTNERRKLLELKLDPGYDSDAISMIKQNLLMLKKNMTCLK